ncbi:MAG TPA: S1 RNA-binding domain-containing protein, partial [Lacunisphaera sp.]|nr:S1 RNA-binding domain-containing protein [Lacunisphaera sp.]
LEKLEDKEGNPILSYEQAQQKKNWENILVKCQEGSVVPGRVKAKVKGGLIVSIGVDSFLPASHIDVQPPKNLDQYVGQTYDFKVLKINHERQNIVLSRRELIEEQRINKRRDLLEKLQPGQIRKGVVKNITDFGAFIDLDGMDGLLHITEMSWTKRITNPSELLKVGQELDAVVLGIQKEEQKISLGLRQLEPNPWDMVRHNYPVGARVRGKVRNMTTYGAFVELEEGIDGMVHVSDMSWTRKINHPSEMLKKGDEVDAIVLDVDPNQQRISLGMKQLATDPWTDIDAFFRIGDVVPGVISKITTFGAFVELKDGIDGLVHISQIQEERVDKVKDVLKPGQEVTARVIKIDRESRRIGLSIKAANYSAEQLAQETATYDQFAKTTGASDLTNLGDIFDEASKKE